MRCFRRAEARFLPPDSEDVNPVELPNINLLLGNNGMGKSATLKAIALAILSPVIESAGYVPYSIVRRDRRKQLPRTEITAEILLHRQDVESHDRTLEEPMTLKTVVLRTRTTERIKRETIEDAIWETMFDDYSPGFFLVGYGASRTIESSESVDLSARRKSRLLRYERVSGLFEEHTTLIPLTAWLPELERNNPGRHKQVTNLIDRLLPEHTHFKGELANGEFLLRHRGLKIELSAMSDGYRAYMGWICDLLYHVCMGCPSGVKLVNNLGIVLIDEIDLHLHPNWQRSILPTLSRTLPNLQFICTTHSPLVAGTVCSANILLLLPDGAQASKLARPDVEIHGLNADQILLSPHFGLNSSRAPSFVEELRKVSKSARSGDRNEAVRFTRMVAHGAGAKQLEANQPTRPAWVERAAEKRKTKRRSS